MIWYVKFRGPPLNWTRRTSSCWEMMSRRSDVKYGGACLMTQHWSIVLFMDMLRARLNRPSSTKYISTDIDLTTIRFSLF